MRNNVNIEKFLKNISKNLLYTLTIIDIIEELIDGERKLYTLNLLIKTKIKNSFNEVEHYRYLIKSKNE